MLSKKVLIVISSSNYLSKIAQKNNWVKRRKAFLLEQKELVTSECDVFAGEHLFSLIKIIEKTSVELYNISIKNKMEEGNVVFPKGKLNEIMNYSDLVYNKTQKIKSKIRMPI